MVEAHVSLQVLPFTPSGNGGGIKNVERWKNIGKTEPLRGLTQGRPAIEVLTLGGKS